MATLRTCIGLRKYIASQFRPSTAKALYDHFEAKKVLDFITGGDVEVLAMKLKMHYNRPRPYQIADYYGIDLNYNKTIQHGISPYQSCIRGTYQ